MYRTQLLVCGGPGCSASSSSKIVENLKAAIAEYKLQDEVEVVCGGCFGFCEKGPVVKVVPDNTFYVKVKPEDAHDIVFEHVLNGRLVDRLLYVDLQTNEKIANEKKIGFYAKQQKIALRNCGLIDPENIEEYIARDGYIALGTCLTQKTRQEVIDIVKASGLRGRGGAGFPAGKKWESAARNAADVKYVVCNADEGDPGAFMDRSVLEGDPHSVLEAMAICGYAIEASKGLIYVRAEYPMAVHRLKVAIAQAHEYGLLGDNIMGTGFNFDIELRYGAGAFVCGEATALIHSMEGLRGEPTVKPPHTSKNGYLLKPTNVNNVETYANVATIIRNGAEWYASIGNQRTTGTKVFALAGKVNNVGLIEVPMGTTLRQVLYEIGGGIKNGKKFKAVQTGGPSGGCLTEKDLDTPIDFDSLKEAGSMMGSGGMIVMDEDDCMVSVAKFYMEFIVEESCGKCTPCRIGNKRLLEILQRICDGKGTEEDLERLKELGKTIKDTALCGLGQSSPNPILSTLENFWDEYEAHVKEHRCPAGQCRALVSYKIDPDKCKGCGACKRGCPVGAIEGDIRQPHKIDPDKCIRCGQCYNNCKFGAISF